MLFRRFLLLGIGIAALGLTTQSAYAQTTITQWNFNSPTPDANTATGTITPSIGAGTITLVGGTTSTFAGGSPSDPAPAADNSGLNLTAFPAAGTGNGTAGVSVAVSTTGFTNIVLSFDFRQSATQSRFFQLQSSVNGTVFTNVSGGTASFGTPPSPNTATSFTNSGLYSNTSGSGSQQFVPTLQYTFASGSALENNPNAAFRFVAVFDPAGTDYIASNAPTSTYSTGGTARFDAVTVSGRSAAVVPEANTVALLGFALPMVVGAVILRRRKK